MSLFGTSYRKLVFLDIETTGTSSEYDKITEIGALVYEDGVLIKTFSKLVNPEIEIPAFITKITGITNQMVIGKPIFEDISDELFEFLDGAIFVAHNVVFDYNFIQNAFKKVGMDYSSDHFCTVQLSRHLYPDFPRHSLDEVMYRMGISCNARHRAFDDAEVISKFYEKAQNLFPEEQFQTTIKRILKQGTK